METIDWTTLTTGGGLVTTTMLFIEALKRLFVDFELKSKTWYPSALNLVTIAVAIGLSLAANYFIIEQPNGNYDITYALLNGLLAGLITVGSYEKVVNLIRLFMKKPNK
jgi:hypothetical protein